MEYCHTLHGANLRRLKLAFLFLAYTPERLLDEGFGLNHEIKSIRMVVSAMTLSSEQKTTSALSSPSERALQQIITREWIDGSNVERCGEAFLSSQETDIVHLDFAEELYSAVLDTAIETWRLLSARQLVGREVRAFKENLGRLYLVSCSSQS